MKSELHERGGYRVCLERHCNCKLSSFVFALRLACLFECMSHQPLIWNENQQEKCLSAHSIAKGANSVVSFCADVELKITLCSMRDENASRGVKTRITPTRQNTALVQKQQRTISESTTSAISNFFARKYEGCFESSWTAWEIQCEMQFVERICETVKRNQKTFLSNLLSKISPFEKFHPLKILNFFFSLLSSQITATESILFMWELRKNC